jgi:hypothetical protein
MVKKKHQVPQVPAPGGGKQDRCRDKNGEWRKSGMTPENYGQINRTSVLGLSFCLRPMKCKETMGFRLFNDVSY